MNRDRRAVLALPLGLLAAAAGAQTTNETSAPATAVPIPAAPVIALPRAPTPTPGPTVQPTPASTTRPVQRARPAERVAPRAQPASRPSPSPTATASPAPIASPTPEPTAVATPIPKPTPLATADPVATELARTPAEVERVENSGWWPGVVAGVLLLAGLCYGAWYWRRARLARRQQEAEARRPQIVVGGDFATPAPPAEPAAGGDAPNFWTPSRPAAPPPAPVVEEAEAAPEPPAARPRLAIALRPRRAGLNLVSATADLELTVRNDGDAPANDIAVVLRLLPGRAGQDGELGELFGGEPTRPVLPPFALAPGEERVCRTTAVLSRGEIEPIPVNDRPMFVPVVAADVRYLLPGGERAQTAAAYVIGAARAGSDKLSPFWLDAPVRMRDEVEARPHGLSIES